MADSDEISGKAAALGCSLISGVCLAAVAVFMLCVWMCTGWMGCRDVKEIHYHHDVAQVERD